MQTLFYGLEYHFSTIFLISIYVQDRIYVEAIDPRCEEYVFGIRHEDIICQVSFKSGL